LGSLRNDTRSWGLAEQWVAAADGVAGAVGDREGKGLEPRGAALGVRDEEDVVEVEAGLELGLHQLDALDGLLCPPAALQGCRRNRGRVTRTIRVP
jgi:hypothetical protein